MRWWRRKREQEFQDAIERVYREHRIARAERIEKLALILQDQLSVERDCSRCGRKATVWPSDDLEVPWQCGACGHHNYLNYLAQGDA